MKQFVLDARTATNHFHGIGRYVSNLAQALVPELRPQEHLTLLCDPSQSSRWQLPTAAEQVTLLNTAVSPFSLRQQWAIPQALRPYKATLYHSAYYLMPYWVGLPTLLTVCDLIPERYPHHVSRRARLFFRLATRLALNRSRHVITISEATRRDLLSSYPISAEKVTAVPLAADPQFQPQPAAEIDRVRQHYHLPESYVLYVGVNKPHKNLARLVTAWKQVIDQTAVTKPKPTLVIAGGWDARFPEVKMKAAELDLIDSIRFLGPVTEERLPALYAGAELFVFPSLYEGFGLPVIEAMACGTAVACANQSSLPEVAGDAALLFDPTHPEAIAAAVSAALADPERRADLSQRGLKQARQFSWSRTAQETIKLYRVVE